MGLIGLGNQGKIHLNTCISFSNAEIIGAADLSKKSQKYAKKMGVKNVYSDYSSLLKNDEIDAVIISLPNFLHSEVVQMAAEAGKDILLEKPMARTVDEANEIVRCVKKCGIKLLMGYNLRFNPIIEEMHKKILNGSIGQVTFVDASNISNGPFSSRSSYEGPVPVPSWWFDKDLTGGGALIDLGCHLINLMNFFFGEPTDVNSYLGYLFNLDVEDSAICNIKYRDGPFTTVRVGWFAHQQALSVQVYGTVKHILKNFSKPNLLNRVSRDMKRKFGRGEHNSQYLELAYFIQCILDDVQPIPSVEEGLQDIKTIELAYKNSIKIQ